MIFRSKWLFSLALGFACCASAVGQTTTLAQSIDFQSDSSLRQEFNQILSHSDPSYLSRSDRIHLFNMPSALPGDPIGMMPDTDFSSSSFADPSESNDGIDDRVQLTLGEDNPFFDLRRHGDPGGVGFYRLYSQMPVFDSQKWSMALVFQGVTPAGLEAEGVASGPTILMPSITGFYETSPGAGIHFFAGKDFEAHSGWTGSLHRDLRYGMALQSAAPAVNDAFLRGFHLYLEALGRYRMDDTNSPAPPRMDLLPGLHWQLADNWWMTGGMLMPLCPQHIDGHLWQLTCFWRF
jgi:hypothetical protein